MSKSLQEQRKDNLDKLNIKLLEDIKKIPLRTRLYVNAEFDLLDLEHDVKRMYESFNEGSTFSEYMNEFRAKHLKRILEIIKEWEEDGRP